MTQQAMDDLDRLTSPAVAKEEEDKRSRSSFRPPFLALTCDITGLEGPYEARLDNGTPVTRIALKLQGIRDVQAVTPFTETSYNLELSLPRPRQDGSPAQPNVHSEVVLMVESAAALAPNITSIRGLVGLKSVRLEERIHDYQGRKQQPQGSGNWVDAPLQTRYYHVVSIGTKAGSNGSAPQVSQEQVDDGFILVQGLSHADALAALGGNGPTIISKLLLDHRIEQKDGVYTAVVAAT